MQDNNSSPQTNKQKNKNKSPKVGLFQNGNPGGHVIRITWHTEAEVAVFMREVCSLSAGVRARFATSENERMSLKEVRKLVELHGESGDAI